MQENLALKSLIECLIERNVDNILLLDLKKEKFTLQNSEIYIYVRFNNTQIM